MARGVFKFPFNAELHKFTAFSTPYIDDGHHALKFRRSKRTCPRFGGCNYAEVVRAGDGSTQFACVFGVEQPYP
jgi:hypothetical protein